MHAQQSPIKSLLIWFWMTVALAFVVPWFAHAQSLTAKADTVLQKRLDTFGIDVVLPRQGKVILVNVPAFELLAIEDGKELFRSRIIVGKPSTPTPLIDTSVSVVRFRPTWRPTPSMIRSGEHRDRIWPPGEKNPLGLAAIRLQPPLLVYLHDTNHRELFDKEQRALSHGCIRVQRWDWLAAWVLDMPLEEVLARAHGRVTHDVPAPDVSVLIRYYTAFPGPDGTLRTFGDVYSRTARRQAADRTTICEPA